MPTATRSYLLGGGDAVAVRVLDSSEFSEQPYQIDLDGTVSLPLAGRIQAAGLSVTDLETDLAERLRKYIRNPQVSIHVAEFGSQPVSVLGSVAAPGVYQVGGDRTLAQLLSLAKGLTPDAGGRILISRRSKKGDSADASEVLEIPVDELLQSSPAVAAFRVQAHDVITVPKARLVYVIGEVKKPGGHVLAGREAVTVLEALSMAEGLLSTAKPKHAKLLRSTAGSTQRTETPIDLNQLLAGRVANPELQADDILLVPRNAIRSASLRAVEAAIQLGTGLIIWRPR